MTRTSRWITGVTTGLVLVVGGVVWVHLSPTTLGQAANVAQIASILSLPLSGWAIVAAKRDLVKERRVTYELDILRELGGMVPVSAGGLMIDEHATVDKVRALVGSLPGSAHLPLTRAALRINPTEQSLRDFAARYSDASPDNRVERFRYLGPTFKDEVQQAIEKTVNR